MIVVLDTNVMVSSFFGGHPHRIINAWIGGQFDLCVSEAVLGEYVRVLDTRTSVSFRERLLDAVTSLPNVLYVSDPKLVELIREDPSDNRFLECAAAGGADYIVSGDHHLLKVRRYLKTSIVRPGQFVELIEVA